MDTSKSKIIFAAIQRANALTDPDIRNDLEKRHKFVGQKIFDDESLTLPEKMEAMIVITQDYDYFKVLHNIGEKRLCQNCLLECLATLYCENCVRIYLRNDFPNWTSGNVDVDNLIQACQIESFRPDNIIEWIPYNKLQDIKYVTKGGFSEIYSANWIDGRYFDWYTEGQRLIRTGKFKVILKNLGNINKADKKWFEEAKIHLTLRNKNGQFVACYGLTKNPTDENYMIVMRFMDADLRKYIQHQRTWKEKLHIASDIIKALAIIHKSGAIHRDLHSGNILYSEYNNHWFISDFGLCGPPDKSSKDIYGNLPFIAPEVLTGKEYTPASDIYSFGILMWEISSGKPPFNGSEHDYYLTKEIIDGMRPKIKTGIPLKYRELMQQCWDADPLKRPDANIISSEFDKMRIDSYNDDESNEFNTLEQDNSSQISNPKMQLQKNKKDVVYVANLKFLIIMHL
ncbi:kinase-like domain-containing protein [Rhizophagus clarus]|uniref:Kinase-like domain-containing protein n=1 Tax=Rhizophagus clarus TaxID=94130 RepID=A0A8H3L8K1_9GLOM|nr:kinase-like domain-containing protein [Rhizophagus clarus]